jgi:hypothetical protein
MCHSLSYVNFETLKKTVTGMRMRDFLKRGALPPLYKMSSLFPSTKYYSREDLINILSRNRVPPKNGGRAANQPTELFSCPYL